MAFLTPLPSSFGTCYFPLLLAVPVSDRLGATAHSHIALQSEPTVSGLQPQPPRAVWLRLAM